jgi:TatD DNase family protein
MIDSHCHLDFEPFKGRLDEIIDAALSAGVHTMINIGADLQSSINTVALSEKYDCIYATVGVHPHDAKTYNDDVEKQFRALLENKKVVAVGEIGLDYYRDLSPRPVQKEAFRRQLELAVDIKKPVVIHTREAFADTLAIIEEFAHRLVGGVFHCFPGNLHDALEVIDLGFEISVGGVVTYPKARMAEIATNTPLENILLETDCPYLAPVPFRGKTNQPAYVQYVRDKIAKLRGISPDEVEKISDRNSRRMYRLVDIGEG